MVPAHGTQRRTSQQRMVLPVLGRAGLLRPLVETCAKKTSIPDTNPSQTPLMSRFVALNMLPFLSLRHLERTTGRSQSMSQAQDAAKMIATYSNLYVPVGVQVRCVTVE